MNEDIEGSIALFFRLQFPIMRLQNALTQANFKPIPLQPPSVNIPSFKIPIARRNDTVISFDPLRYLFQLKGPVLHLSDELEEVIEIFKEERYDLNNIIHYLEFNTTFEIIEEKWLEKFNNRIKFDSINNIKTLLGENDIKTYNITFSNSFSPLNNKWLSLKIIPDTNSDEIINIRLVKRTETSATMKEFLTTFTSNFDEIVDSFVEE